MIYFIGYWLINYTHFKCVCSHMLISGGHTHKEIHLYFHYLQFGHYIHVSSNKNNMLFMDKVKK
jgi:hypothetical protein